MAWYSMALPTARGSDCYMAPCVPDGLNFCLQPLHFDHQSIEEVFRRLSFCGYSDFDLWVGGGLRGLLWTELTNIVYWFDWKLWLVLDYCLCILLLNDAYSTIAFTHIYHSILDKQQFFFYWDVKAITCNVRKFYQLLHWGHAK